MPLNYLVYINITFNIASIFLNYYIKVFVVISETISLILVILLLTSKSIHLTSKILLKYIN